MSAHVDNVYLIQGAKIVRKNLQIFDIMKKNLNFIFDSTNFTIDEMVRFFPNIVFFKYFQLIYIRKNRILEKMKVAFSKRILL